jgi:transposase
MAKPLLSDELWEVIGPILPQRAPGLKGGRPRLDDRRGAKKGGRG